MRNRSVATARGCVKAICSRTKRWQPATWTKKLKLVEPDAAQLPRSLDDLAAASVNNDYAVKAGLSLQRDAIAVGDAKGPYAKLNVTRAEDKDKPWVKKLVKAYSSEEVRKFIEAEFKGSLIPAF